MKRTLIIMLCSLWSAVGTALAQNNKYNPVLPSLPYLSPEAASLGKYGEIPVSEYTGVPDIRIPLHTVKAGDLELPIALTYHASGIKVAQEATWVGLGWDLQAGGCINRIISGNYDRASVNNSTWAERAKFYAQKNTPFYSYGDNSIWGGVEENPGTAIYKMSLYQDFLFGLGEPDIFQANFCGHSLTFIIHPGTRQPVMVGDADLTYRIEALDASQNDWRITDSHGIAYCFDRTGAEVASGNSTHYLSSWFLTRIIHPQRGMIVLDYDTQTNRIKAIPGLAQTQLEAEYAETLITNGIVTAGHVNPNLLGVKDHWLYDGYTLEKKYLTSITTDLERVDFHTSTREDIEGSSRKLDRITVTSLCDNRVTNHIVFDYSYYEGENCGGDYLADKQNAPLTPYRYKRLKLDEMTVDGRTYGFEYNSTPLPYKTSYATDFWGYFNGMSPNKSFLCAANLKELAEGKQLSPLGDANRYADPESAKAGILQKITYPTKGSTVFEFEPNTFVEAGTWCPQASKATYVARRDTLVRAFCTCNTSAYANVPFTLDEPTTVEVEFVVSSPSNYLTDLSTAHARVMSMDGTGVNKSYHIPGHMLGEASHSYTFKETVTLPAAHYLIYTAFPKDKCGSDNGYSSITQLTVKYRKPGIVYVPEVSYGGGLRVASMSHYDADGTLLRKQSYDYSGDNLPSSGRLLMPVPKVVDDVLYVGTVSSIMTPTGVVSQSAALDRWKSHTLSSAAKVPAITAISGTPVGYSRVVMRESAEGADAGFTESYFHNLYPTYYFGDVRLFQTHMNGRPRQQTAYDAKGRPVRKQRFVYNSLATPVMLNAFATDVAPGIDDCVLFLGLKRYRIQAYPFSQVWNTMTERRTTHYYYSDTLTEQREEVETFSYDSAKRRLSATKRKMNGSAETFSRQLRYADEVFKGAVADSLVARNMTGFPVETIEQHDGTATSRTRQDYALFGGRPRMSGISIGKGNDGYEQRTRFVRYDSNGNLLEKVRPDGVRVAYLWSYRSQYPIAEIEGMSYNEVIARLSASEKTAISAGNVSMELLRSVRQKCSGALVKAQRYLPLVGVAGELDAGGYGVEHSYDSFGRLSETRESHNGHLLKSYQYNYKP